MPLTLNQFLLLVLTMTAVAAVTAWVIFLIQLKKTVKEGEKTLSEIQSLAGNLSSLSLKIHQKMDDVGDAVESAKKAADHLAEIAWFITSKIIRPGSRFWPLLFPLIKMGWRHGKKKKEEIK